MQHKLKVEMSISSLVDTSTLFGRWQNGGTVKFELVQGLLQQVKYLEPRWV